MTNAEAIKIAQGLITVFKYESETIVEFCNTVIEALSEPTIPLSVIEDIKAELHTLWDNEPCVTEHGCDKEVYDLIDRKVNEVKQNE